MSKCTFDPDESFRIHLQPCDALRNVLNRSGHPHGGFQYINKTHLFFEDDLSESFHYGIVLIFSGPSRKKHRGGVLPNCCPFCATDFSLFFDRYTAWQESGGRIDACVEN